MPWRRILGLALGLQYILVITASGLFHSHGSHYRSARGSHSGHSQQGHSHACCAPSYAACGHSHESRGTVESPGSSFLQGGSGNDCCSICSFLAQKVVPPAYREDSTRPTPVPGYIPSAV